MQDLAHRTALMICMRCVKSRKRDGDCLVEISTLLRNAGAKVSIILHKPLTGLKISAELQNNAKWSLENADLLRRAISNGDLNVNADCSC